MSLADYASKHRVHRNDPPWITTIPEWDEILAFWQSGGGLAAIRDWLIAPKNGKPAGRGYPIEEITPGRLSYLAKSYRRTK